MNIELLTGQHEVEITALLDEAFGAAKESHYVDDFPIWSRHFLNRRNLKGIFLDGKLVSISGDRTAPCQIQNKVSEVAFIGAVATHPLYRKKGLASLLLKHQLEIIDAQKTQLTLLWSGDQKFYAKFGFKPVGIQGRVCLREILSAQPKNTSLRKGLNRSIFEKLMTRKRGVILNEFDFLLIEAHRNVTWYSLVDDTGEVLAYAAYGKGIDLPHHIHEWGGEKEPLLELLSIILAEHSTAEWIGPIDLARKFFSEKKDFIIEENVCLARLGDDFSKKTDLNQLWLWGLDSV